MEMQITACVIAISITIMTSPQPTDSFNCTYPGNMCEVDAQNCLNFTYARARIHPMCETNHTVLYEREKGVNFFVDLRRRHRLRGGYEGTYSIIHEADNGTFTHVKGCCNIPFGKSCLLQWNKNGRLSIKAAGKRGVYCIHPIYAETRPEPPEWCCDLFDSTNCTTHGRCSPKCKQMNCLTTHVGKLTLKRKWNQISIDTTPRNDYCFFELPGEHADLGFRTTRDKLIRNIPDVLLINSAVRYNDNTVHCTFRNDSYLYERNKTDFKWHHGYRWCFFVRSSHDDAGWKEYPDCYEACDTNQCLYDGDIVIPLATTLSAMALLILLAVIYKHKKRIERLFPSEKECIKEIPNCTKEVLLEELESKGISQRKEYVHTVNFRTEDENLNQSSGHRETQSLEDYVMTGDCNVNAMEDGISDELLRKISEARETAILDDYVISDHLGVKLDGSSNVIDEAFFSDGDDSALVAVPYVTQSTSDGMLYKIPEVREMTILDDHVITDHRSIMSGCSSNNIDEAFVSDGDDAVGDSGLVVVSYAVQSTTADDQSDSGYVDEASLLPVTSSNRERVSSGGTNIDSGVFSMDLADNETPFQQ